LTGTTATDAGISTRPFDAIARGNVFRLKPRLPEIHPPPPAEARLRITLQGVTTILGRPQALLSLQEVTSAGTARSNRSCVVAEGESQQGVAVLEVNWQTGRVRLDHLGRELVLTTHP